MKTVNIIESSNELIDGLTKDENSNRILPNKIYIQVGSFSMPYVKLKGDENFELLSGTNFQDIVLAMANKLGIEIEFSKI